MEQRKHLPVHPLSPEARAQAAAPRLAIEGLVAEPRSLSPDDLATLPRSTLAEPFVCEEGWMVPGLRWEGVRLGHILALAAPLPTARYVRVCSGAYAVPLALEEARAALLCDRLNGAPLPLEHGAPWRLVVPGGRCFTSVKWVTRLELAAEPGEPTGEQIARARLR
jgi:DMSO/TMAO reductase YedYZ molybdopterin-dependent catalytic subunit